MKLAIQQHTIPLLPSNNEWVESDVMAIQYGKLDVNDKSELAFQKSQHPFHLQGFILKNFDEDSLIARVVDFFKEKAVIIKEIGY